LARQVDEEIEISVWGGSSNMQDSLESRGLSVRRLGRIIRVKVESEDTISIILECAVESGVQIRRMGEYEPDLEDIFLLIMDKLGAEVKTTSDLMTSEHTGGGIISDKIIDLDGGQTRMEAAYGSDEGDEDLFAITAKREASIGAIFEQNYRPWDGDFGPRWVRNYAIFGIMFLVLFTSKGHRNYNPFIRLTILVIFIGAISPIAMLFFSSLFGLVPMDLLTKCGVLIGAIFGGKYWVISQEIYVIGLF
jgi:hypothetical protein